MINRLVLLACVAILGACGSKSGPTDCSQSNTSSRVDSNQSCELYGNAAWSDLRLADSDAECIAYMSATDAPGQARLPSFCKCLSESMAGRVSYDTYSTGQLDAIKAEYEMNGDVCSQKAEYAIPSPRAGTIFTHRLYAVFMSDCLETGSSRSACRCLAEANAKEGTGSFERSGENNKHKCAVINK